MNKKVITYGTFDLFHEGHERLLKRAKALGDYLIVGVTSDYFDKQRGKMNVEESLLERIENIKKSGYADEIIVEEYNGQKIIDIQKHQIDIFTVGSDWINEFDYLKEYCEVVYLERTEDISSSELRNMKHSIIHIGIVGTGRIAWRTALELNYISGTYNNAVYNPKLESATKFAQQYNIPLAFDNYNQFLDKVNAVYIASPHETHFEYAKKALELGKHVLCEKPMVLSKKEAIELFDIAEKNNLVLMEAIKTAYAPGFLNLISLVKQGKIGQVIDIEATFTKLISKKENQKEQSQREYNPKIGGSFTELATYPLLPILKLFGKNYTSLDFKYLMQDNVDIYSKAYFQYENAFATAKVGIGAKSEGQLIVTGTKGYILAKSPWWLTKSFTVCYEDTNENEYFSAPFEGYGLRYELSDFVNQIRNIDSTTYKLSKEDSIFLADIMEKFLQDRKKFEL